MVKAGGVDTSIDRAALHNYMSFHAVVPPPRTIYEGCAQAAPGDTPRLRTEWPVLLTAAIGRRLPIVRLSGRRRR
jgi:hypothetical protein